MWCTQVVQGSLPGTRGGHSFSKLSSNQGILFGGANHEANGYDDLWLLDFSEQSPLS